MKIKNSFLKYIISIMSLFTIPLASFAQAGSLDISFDIDGKVTTPIGIAQNQGRSVAIQVDGKIVVAGSSEDGPKDDFALVRYNTNGSLDTTFDTDGKVTTAVGTSYDEGISVVIQPDGKIVVAGYSYTGSKSDFALVRYNSNGSLDSTFDTDGKLTTSIGTFGDFGLSVAIQADGKIVVAGYSDTGSNDDFALVRYNTNGSLDNTFDFDGIVTTPIGTSNDRGNSVTIQSDGKIIVAGWSYNGSYNVFALVRYNTNGSLDNSFDTDGKVTTAIGTVDDKGKSVAVQIDGKIVVAGYSYGVADFDFALVRYNTNGSLDNTFDTDGKVTTAIGISYDEANSVVIQSDGKIVVAGYSSNGTDNDFALARYDTNGNLDNTFDMDGIVTSPIGTIDDVGLSVALQVDGKIVVAGYTNNSPLDPLVFFTVVRYMNNGSAGINNIDKHLSETNIYPNPFSILTTLKSDTFFNNATLTIFNSFGKQVKLLKNLYGQTLTIHRDNLSSGIYFIQLIQDNKVVAIDKLIITDN